VFTTGLSHNHAEPEELNLFSTIDLKVTQTAIGWFSCGLLAIDYLPILIISLPLA
jgi:hypothetical protein